MFYCCDDDEELLCLTGFANVKQPTSESGETPSGPSSAKAEASPMDRSRMIRLVNANGSIRSAS